MKLTKKQMKKKLSASGMIAAGQEDRLYEAVQISRAAFYEGEAEDILSDFEFLYWQSQWIRKRWWVLQGLLLAVLWSLLKLTESSYYIQRYMGIMAPLFAMLILPELWKNRSCHALEIEGTAYFSLRQIYAARMFLFVLVDFFLLAVFAAASIWTGNIPVEEMIVQFFLPYFVTCCICFRTLYSSRISSEVFALFLCIVWCMVWVLIVLDEKIYAQVYQPVWIGMTAVCVLYLGYCIRRGQKKLALQPLLTENNF